MSEKKVNREDCENCRGTGRMYPDCEECGGDGWVYEPNGGGTKTCPTCEAEECDECEVQNVVTAELTTAPTDRN